MAMKAELTIDGMADLRAALQQLPEHLRGEAAKIVQAEANAANVAIRRVYVEHVASGRLLRGLTLKPLTRNQGAAYQIRSSSPIAWLFDNGSQARHWKSGSQRSTGEMWGASAPSHIFARTLSAARKNMVNALALLLSRVGLQVTGRAA